MKTLKIRVLCGLIITALALFVGIRLYYNLTDDFRLANIQYDTPNRSEWAVPPRSSSEASALHEVLTQQFTYIGKGAQSYAFGSADGKYVIKFFKFKHLRPSFWLDYLPPIFGLQSYRDKQYQRKERKLEGVFAGYRLAYLLHRHDSGLLYVHLNTTENLYPFLTVLDKMGWKHSIPLDDVVFILQERAETARAVVHNLLKDRNIEGAKRKIDQIFDLYLSEYAKGIFDNDHGVMRNVGFVGDHAIRIDVGKLKNSPSIRELANYSHDLIMTGDRMIASLYQNENQDFTELKTYIENKVSDIIGRPYIFSTKIPKKP